MASIHKKENGEGYFVRWREAGRNRSRPAPTRAAAKALKLEVESALAVGKRWEPTELRGAPGVEEVAVKYIEALAVRCAPRTVIAQASALDAWTTWLKTVEAWRHRQPIDEVFSLSMLEDYVRHLSGRRCRRKKTPVEPSTIREYVGAVERFWKWIAERDDYEAFRVRSPRRLLPDMAKPPSRAVLAPTWVQMAACIQQLSGRERMLAIVLYYTGLRVDQAMRLLWSDVDLELGTLEVRGELGKTQQERAGRLIPVSPHLVAELKRWPHPELWIIPTKPTGGRFGRFATTQAMRDAWKAARVPEQVWRRRPHHCMRAGFQTGLLAIGVSYDAAEVLVGHAVSSELSREVLVGNALRGSGRDYVDLAQLPLRAAVNQIPALPETCRLEVE